MKTNTKALGLLFSTPFLMAYGIKHNDETRFPQLDILMKQYYPLQKRTDALSSMAVIDVVTDLGIREQIEEFKMLKPSKMVQYEYLEKSLIA